MGLKLTYMGLKLTYMGLKLTYMGLKLTYIGPKLTYMGPKLTLEESILSTCVSKNSSKIGNLLARKVATSDATFEGINFVRMFLELYKDW